MSQFLHFLRSLGLLIARLGVGGIMISHGLTRWQGQGQGIQKQIDYLTLLIGHGLGLLLGRRTRLATRLG